MSLDTPEISVAMCTYNGAAYLAEQLESIAAQDRLPDELVVCDDGSTDATRSLVEQFARSSPFSVRLWVNRESLGSTQNFAKAMGLCRGRLIFLADQDDVWMPQKVRRLSQVLSATSGLAFAFSDARLVDRHGRPMGCNLWEALSFGSADRARFNARQAFDVLLRRNVVTGTTVAFRAEYCSVLLPIPSGWVHDGWLALLLSALGNGRAVAEPLVDYRQHGAQQIGARPETLLDKYRRRKRQGRTLYGTTAENYAAALERLQSLADCLPDRRVLDGLRRKVDHWRARARMRVEGHWRVPIIAGELFHRSYERYSSGWRSAAEDVLL